MGSRMKVVKIKEHRRSFLTPITFSDTEYQFLFIKNLTLTAGDGDLKTSIVQNQKIATFSN